MKDERTEINDAFAKRLVDYDEALQAGSHFATPKVHSDDADSQLGQRLQRARHCLAFIERVRRTAPDSLSGLLDSPTASDPLGDLDETPATMGRFQIVRELGRGGYGVVFLAVDPELDREVALKVPRPEVILSADLKRRFVREGKAAASLNHANIVPVFEVGHTGSIFYIASAYCDGASLSQWLQNRNQPVEPQVAAEMVRTLAEAVQHAHSRGVVHRDLKPANILLSVVRDQESSATKGRIEIERNSNSWLLMTIPKITDFGLAKTLQSDGETTHTGAILGTPSYMAPEQAKGEKDIGPSADIFALGAILYELLTGRPPFRRESDMATLRSVELDEPVRPKRLRKAIPHDLESICLKALAKKPEHRYLTGTALAEDLRCFLDGEPIRARRVSAWERGVMWVRRHPAVTGSILMSIVAATALAGLGFFVWTNRQLTESKQMLEKSNAHLDRARGLLAEQMKKKERALRSEKAAKMALQNEKQITEAAFEQNQNLLYFANILMAERKWRDGHAIAARRLLDDCPPDLRHWEWHYLHRLFHSEASTYHGHKGPIREALFSPDGTQIASAGADGKVLIRNAMDGKILQTFSGFQKQVRRIAFSPDGKLLAAGSEDGAVKWWRLETANLVHSVTKRTSVTAIAFSHDSRRLVVARVGLKTLSVYDTKSTRQIAKWQQTGVICDVATGSNGRHVVVAYFGHPPELLDAASGESLGIFQKHSGLIQRIALSPNADLLAAATADGSVILWNVASRKRLAIWKAGDRFIRDVAFGPLGKRLATAGSDKSIKVWDVKTRRLLKTFIGHTQVVATVDFSPDGRWIVSADSGLDSGCLKLWNVEHKLFVELRGYRQPFLDLAFGIDGARLAACNGSEGVGIWNVETGKMLNKLKTPGLFREFVAFSPDGNQLAVAYAYTDRLHNEIVFKGKIKLFDTTAFREFFTLPASMAINGVTFSPNGKILAITGRKGVQIWDSTSRKPTHFLKGHEKTVTGVDFSPDGCRIATVSLDQTVRIWDWRSGDQTNVIRGLNPSSSGVSYGPLGKYLAIASCDGQIHLLNATSGNPMKRLSGHTGPVTSAAFTPDGKRLASGGNDGTVRLWNLQIGREILTLRAKSKVFAVRFSRDGKRLAAGGAYGALRIWNH